MAPRKTAKKSTGPTKVEAHVHQDKRTNIPTADAAAQYEVPAELEAPTQLFYERDPSLDPQLVWKGKDAQDSEDLAVTAPPIFIQEKIDPRVLVENLRQTSKAGEPEPELTLFDTFDGLDDLDMVEYYQHEANWSNRMILGDSLQVMASLAEREALRGRVQMIYIDPPYGIKFGSNWQRSASKRAVNDGKLEDLTFEIEQIKAFRDTWELGIHSYLSYLRDRLVVARDLLTDTGSCFVQIGEQNLHHVRELMQEVFGEENFVVQIAIQKTGGLSGAFLESNVDYIVWFAKSKPIAKYRPLFIERGRKSGAIDPGYRNVTLSDGTDRPISEEERANPDLLPAGARPWSSNPLTSDGFRPATTVNFEFEGRVFHPGTKSHWKVLPEDLRRVALAGRIVAQRTQIRHKAYADDFPVTPLGSYWNDVGGAVQPIYVVQTTTKVIERCMLMCSDPGDLVLDPTCGSGSTAFVAEQWGRRWITLDTSRVALALARQRLMASQFLFYLLADSPEGRLKEAELSATPQSAEPTSGDLRRGFVFQRVPHVTLTAIAKNPDIVEGMSVSEIDAAIKRHADFELLYDKPGEDKKRVRVAGPFTVESLSPHRSLAFAGEAPAGAVPASEVESDFTPMILENLAKAGIQNGRKKERLNFDTVEPYAGDYVQAVGESEAQRVGIAVGPQYGTVGSAFIKQAAREALKAEPRIDLLAVLAFSFDPQALGKDNEYVSTTEGFADVAAERSLGRLPVLLVQMNNDLVMGDDLKKTGAGNLFTVFGEPDIEITTEGDEVTVEVRGVDVYDPTTGEVRSANTDLIALWMIDTNYNEESFFVRHCYFTGGNDPYARLKKALKADINEEAWATLYSTTSRPFPKPDTGKIAVKVINDYGDEVLKVFEV